MDLRLLELFVRVAEIGSINRASANLGLSQPALSRHMAALEHQIGSKLLIRARSGVQLTDAGRLLVERAQPLLRQILQLKEQLREKATGRLAIGLPSAWQHLINTPFVESLTRQFPDIALRVHEGVSNLLSEDMSASLLDLAIVPLEVAPGLGYQTSPLAREAIVLVGRLADALQVNRPVAIGEVTRLKLALPTRPNAARARL